MNAYNVYGDSMECDYGHVAEGDGAVVATDSIDDGNMETDEDGDVDIRSQYLYIVQCI